MDFFVSYAGPDRPWAEWVAQQLEAAGYSVELDVWDWAAGSNAVLRMSEALAKSRWVVALFSAAYFAPERFTTDEWTAVLAERPGADGRRRLIPLRVEPVVPPAILRPLVYRDLFGLDEARARAELLAAVDGRSGRPTSPVPFPAEPARVPGSYPPVWKVPRRNPAFTGRRALLAALREQLSGGDRAVVQALSGMGGVGKTQLAIEYAHLFAGEYDLVWWVDAERPELIGEQLAALGVAAGWVPEGTAVAVPAVMAKLRGMGRWLLVFDNAEVADQLAEWLPPESGHVVITTRSGGFGELARPVEVDVFTRPESAALLREQVPRLADADADGLAEALGDLPLALAQAAGLMRETGMGAAEYLGELAKHAREVLAEGKPVGYPVSLAAAIDLAVDRLDGEDPAAVQLLRLCALLAPEPIRLSWFSSAPSGVLKKPLARVVTAPLPFRRSCARLARLGLVRLGEGTVQVHRLTQAAVRDRGTAEQQQDYRRRAEELIAAAEPDNDGTDPTSWPDWAALLPHLLTLDPGHGGERLRSTACNALWYLQMRGEYHTARPLAEDWHQRWRAALAPDDPHVWWVARLRASTHRFLGQHAVARQLNEDVLARDRRVLGEDDPYTLVSANNLADVLRALGELAAARQLNEDTLARRRRVLGEDHPHTLSSALNLATSLQDLGELAAARRLHEDTLARRRRVLGEDHPNTLASANNFANTLRALGEIAAARRLDEDTLARRRRVLGEDHPETLRSATNLADDLRALGEEEAARRLEEEAAARRGRQMGSSE